MDSDNPFEVELQNTVRSASGDDSVDFEKLVRRLVEIQDELRSRGIDPLVEEEKDLKARLKKLMQKRNVDIVYDEVSNYEAVLTPRTKEEWNIAALKKMLSPSQRKRYVKTHEFIDLVALKEGQHNGDVSQRDLEKSGAVKREVSTLALYVRERKKADGE